MTSHWNFISTARLDVPDSFAVCTLLKYLNLANQIISWIYPTKCMVWPTVSRTSFCALPKSLKTKGTE